MTAPALTKPNAKAIEQAKLYLASGNSGAFARAVSSIHRASNNRQQAALEAVIADTQTSHLFARCNGALVAV